MKCFLNESNCGAGCKAHEDGECLLLVRITEISKSLKSLERHAKDATRVMVRRKQGPIPKP